MSASIPKSYGRVGRNAGRSVLYLFHPTLVRPVAEAKTAPRFDTRRIFAINENAINENTAMIFSSHQNSQLTARWIISLGDSPATHRSALALAREQPHDRLGRYRSRAHRSREEGWSIAARHQPSSPRARDPCVASLLAGRRVPAHRPVRPGVELRESGSGPAWDAVPLRP